MIALLDERRGLSPPDRRDKPRGSYPTTGVNPAARRFYDSPLTTHHLNRCQDGVRDFGPLSARLEAAAKDAPTFGDVPVQAVTMFRSEPGRNGSRYTALDRFPLINP